MLIRCANWISKCQLDIPLDVVLRKPMKLCGIHFEKSMFLNGLQNRLKPNAIPTLLTSKKYHVLKIKYNLLCYAFIVY